MAALLARLEELALQGPERAPTPELISDARCEAGWEPVGSAAEPALVLYSFMTPHAEEVRREVATLREAHGSAVRLMAGGAHASGAPQDTLAMGFHWVVRGEAAEGFAALLRSLWSGAPSPPAGVVEGGPPRALDREPPWPRSGALFCPIDLTRGCPQACRFCQTPRLHGHRPRHRSLQSIDALVRHARDTGHSFTRFVSPNALGWGAADGRTPDLHRLETLFRRLRRRGFEKVFFGNFPSEVRPESVTPDVLRLLAEHVDNRSLVVGLQSGSDAMLRRIRRGHSVEQGVRAVTRIARAGFRPAVDFIFGLPGETDADRDQTRALMRHLVDTYDARINSHVFTPLPGTPFADAPPGRVDAKTQRLVRELVGRGSAAGHDVG